MHFPHYSEFKPKFIHRQRYDLTDTLRKICLINMTKRVLNKLFISNVIHEALVEVNETGTAASAATVIHADYCAVGVLKQTKPVIFQSQSSFYLFHHSQT